MEMPRDRPIVTTYQPLMGNKQLEEKCGLWPTPVGLCPRGLLSYMGFCPMGFCPTLAQTTLSHARACLLGFEN